MIYHLLLSVSSCIGQILATALVRCLLSRLFASKSFRNFFSEVTGVENEAGNVFTLFVHQINNEL